MQKHQADGKSAKDAAIGEARLWSGFKGVEKKGGSEPPGWGSTPVRPSGEVDSTIIVINPQGREGAASSPRLFPHTFIQHTSEKIPQDVLHVGVGTWKTHRQLRLDN